MHSSVKTRIRRNRGGSAFFPYHCCVKYGEETQTLALALIYSRWRKCIAPNREESTLIRRVLFAVVTASVCAGFVALNDQCAVACIRIRIHAPLPLTSDIGAGTNILILFARRISEVVMALWALREVWRFLALSDTTEQLQWIDATRSRLRYAWLRLCEGASSCDPRVAQGFLWWHSNFGI